MTSQRSQKNNPLLSRQRELMGRRLWLIALSGVMAMLYYLVVPAIMFISVRGSLHGAKLTEELARWAWRYYGWNNPLNVSGVSFMAMVFAISGFSWLYQMKSVVFFESQPVSKKDRFWSTVINSIVIAAAVTGAGFIISIILTAAMGAGFPALYLSMAIEWVRTLILFSSVYAVYSVAAVVSGNVVVAVLGCQFLTGIEFALRLAVFGAANLYLSTLHTDDSFGWLKPSLMPSYLHQAGGSAMLSYEGGKLPGPGKVLSVEAGFIPAEAVMIIIAVVAIAVAFIAYLRRPAEAADRALAFEVCEWVVKLPLSFLSGLMLWFIIDGITMSCHRFINPLSVLFMAAAAALCAMVCEVVFTADIRSAFRRWQAIPCVCAAVFVFVACFKLDVTGFDRYLPKAEDVESYSFTLDKLADQTLADDEGNAIDYDGVSRYYDENMILKNSEDMVHLAGTGMEGSRIRDRAAEEGRKVLYSPEKGFYTKKVKEAKYDDLITGTVLYRMKNGRRIRRDLALPRETDPKAADAVISQPGYIRVVYPISNLKKMIERDHPKNISINDTINSADNEEFEDISKDISEKEACEFLDCFGRDVENLDFRTEVEIIDNCEEEYSAGQIWISYNYGRQETRDLSLRICEDDRYKNTLRWMKDNM